MSRKFGAIAFESVANAGVIAGNKLYTVSPHIAYTGCVFFSRHRYSLFVTQCNAGSLLAVGGILYIPIKTLLEVSELNKSVSDLTKGQAELIKSMSDLTKGQAELIKSMSDLKKRQAELSKSVNTLTTSVSELKTGLASFSVR